MRLLPLWNENRLDARQKLCLFQSRKILLFFFSKATVMKKIVTIIACISEMRVQTFSSLPAMSCFSWSMPRVPIKKRWKEKKKSQKTTLELSRSIRTTCIRINFRYLGQKESGRLQLKRATLLIGRLNGSFENSLCANFEKKGKLLASAIHRGNISELIRKSRSGAWTSNENVSDVSIAVLTTRSFIGRW